MTVGLSANAAGSIIWNRTLDTVIVKQLMLFATIVAAFTM
jgi:hypothetical protein